MIQLQDGRLLAVAGALDKDTGEVGPTPVRAEPRRPGLFRDHGVTGFRGQPPSSSSCPTAACSPPIGATTSQASGPRRRGSGRRWINEETAPLWQGADFGHGRARSPAARSWRTLKFGFPQMLVRPDGDVMLVFWCEEDCIKNIRWLRIRVEAGGRVSAASGHRSGGNRGTEVAAYTRCASGCARRRATSTSTTAGIRSRRGSGRSRSRELAARLGFESIWTGEHVTSKWGGAGLDAFDCLGADHGHRRAGAGRRDRLLRHQLHVPQPGAHGQDGGHAGRHHRGTRRAGPRRRLPPDRGGHVRLRLSRHRRAAGDAGRSTSRS